MTLQGYYLDLVNFYTTIKLALQGKNDEKKRIIFMNFLKKLYGYRTLSKRCRV